MISDMFLIYFASLGSALIAEGLSWLLIYRTEDYQKLKSTIEKLQKKVDKKKDTGSPAQTSIQTKSSKERKIDRYEETLKTSNRDMAMVRMKSMFAVGVALISLLGVLNSSFDGQVVAKLPFEPLGFLTGISHRNLPGKDYTDSSMIFLYVLTSMAIRANLQKILGVTPPSTKNLFSA